MLTRSKVRPVFGVSVKTHLVSKVGRQAARCSADAAPCRSIRKGLSAQLEYRAPDRLALDQDLRPVSAGGERLQAQVVDVVAAVDPEVGAAIGRQRVLGLVDRAARRTRERRRKSRRRVLPRSVEEALAALAPAAKKAGISPQRLLLDLAALCRYPDAHEHTLLPPLGMKTSTHLPRRPETAPRRSGASDDPPRAWTAHAAETLLTIRAPNPAAFLTWIPATYVARGGYDLTDEFLFGLDVILDGFERLLGRTESPERS